MKNLLMVRTQTFPVRMSRLVVAVLFAALLSAVPFHAALAQTAPDLGSAANFAVLGGTNVTCTAPGSIIGDVGVSPGSAVPFTNTGCTITGATPPATNTAAVGARIDFLDAYADLAPKTGDCDLAHTLLSTITGPVTLLPGVYCTGAALTGTGVLLLDGGGDTNAVWIFKIGAALVGTNFSVVMTGGGQPCNVFWWVGGHTTMTTSAFSGNILAGAPAGAADPGSITFTDVTLAGRALANVAVTMTRPNVIGCSSLVPPPPIDKDHCKHYCKDYDKDYCKDYWKDYWKEYWKDQNTYHCKDHEKEYCKDHYCKDHDKNRCKDNDKDSRDRR
jgi:hypothetical protein